MRRVALIVGVSRYDRDPSIRQLQFVDSDCTELHGLLKHQCGYDQVQSLRDPTKREVLDNVEEIGAALGAGDLLLFYFAGHGVEFDSKHLLLCRPAKLAWLKHFDEVIPVDHLRDLTARSGAERVFILDSCRSDLTLTRGAVGAGLRGEQSLRDVVARKSALPTPEGPLTILCSCSEGRQALELHDRKQGLFTAALLDVFQEALGQGREVRLSDEFQDVLAKRMTDLACRSGQTWEQRPWVQRCGPAPLLLAGRLSPVVESAPAPKVVEVPAPKAVAAPAPSGDKIEGPVPVKPVRPAPVKPPPISATPPIVAPPKLPAGRAASLLPGELLAFRVKALARQIDRVLSHAQMGRLQIGTTASHITPAQAAAWLRRNVEGMVALSDWHQFCGSGDLDRELVVYGNHAAPWLTQIDRRILDINKARADTQGGPSYDRPARRLLNLVYNWALVVRDMDKARGYLKRAEAAASSAMDWAMLAGAVRHVLGDQGRARALWQKAAACATPEWLGFLAAVGLDLGASPDQARDTLSCGEQSVNGVSDLTNLANYWLDLLGDVEAAERCARKAISVAHDALDGVHLESMACRFVDAGRLAVAEEVLGAMAALPEGDVDPTFIKVELAVDWAHLLGREEKAREVMKSAEQAVLRMDQTVLGKMAVSEWLRLAEGWSVLRDSAWSQNALQQAAARCVKIENRAKVEAVAKRLFPGMALRFPTPKPKGWFG